MPLIDRRAAELGRTGGGVVQMTTRSGTNLLHGSAYEYFRNDALDARRIFSVTKPTLRYNLFGASIGGPIRKDKTHYFFNDFTLHERHRLQFRTEMLNFINNANFDLPGLQRGSPTFGRITSLIDGNQARIVQFGLHYKL